MSHADNLSRALLALILLCLVVGILRGDGGAKSGPSAATAAAALPANLERFGFRIIGLQRKPPLLLRTDSATGEAWTMGVLAAGVWEALREGPAGVPSPGADVAGRYEIFAVKLTRGAPNLVRTDLLTGRVWRKGSTNGGPWVLVPNPGEPAPAAARTPAANAAAETAEASGDAAE